LELLRKAAVLAPHEPSISYHLGTALANAGEELEAKELLERVLRDYPDFPESKDAAALLERLRDSGA